MIERRETKRLKLMEYYGFGIEAMKKSKVCTSCGRLSFSNVKQCKECGAKLPEEDVYQMYKKRHQYCPECDTIVSSKKNFCPQCGTQLSERQLAYK